jgi:hypothetical protein
MAKEQKLAINGPGLWRIFSRIACIILAVSVGQWFFTYAGGFLSWLNGFENITLPSTAREFEAFQYGTTILVSFICYRIFLYNVKRNIVKLVYKTEKKKVKYDSVRNPEPKKEVEMRFQ